MQLRPEERDVQPDEACACQSPICYAVFNSGIAVCLANQQEATKEPGIIDGRFWWDQKSEYWDLPFYSELGLSTNIYMDFDDALAGREQLFAIREGLTDI